jgi:hypothetical protein
MARRTPGNPPAKNYAFAGIKKLNNARSYQLRMSLRSSDEKVN